MNRLQRVRIGNVVVFVVSLYRESDFRQPKGTTHSGIEESKCRKLQNRGWLGRSIRVNIR